MDALGAMDVLGMLCVRSSCGSDRLLDLGSWFGKKIPINAGNRIHLPSGGAWDWDPSGLGAAAPELLQGKLSCLPWQRCLTNPSGNLSLGKPSLCKHGPDDVPGSASRSSSPVPGLRGDLAAGAGREG